MGNTPVPPHTTESDQNMPQDDYQDTPTVKDIQMSKQPDQNKISQTNTTNLSHEPLSVELPDVYGNLTAVPNPALQKTTWSG